MPHSYASLRKKDPRTQVFFTPRFILERAERMLRRLPPDVRTFVDLSAGDGALGSLLLQRGRWDRVVSVDTHRWPGVMDRGHEFHEADGLCFQPPTRRCCVGFNPPYGKANQQTRRFVMRAYELGIPYACWLIPRGQERFLRRYYTLLDEQKYPRMPLFQSPHDQRRTISPMWVCLWLARRLDQPNAVVVRQPRLPTGITCSGRRWAEGTNFVARIVGAHTPFPIFVKGDAGWTMYNVVQGVASAAPAVVGEKPMSISYRERMRKRPKLAHVTLADYVVGGNAFAKFAHVPEDVAQRVVRMLSALMRRHQELRRREREAARTFRGTAVQRYEHMLAVYYTHKRDFIEDSWSSFQPASWSTDKLIEAIQATYDTD